MKRTIVIFCLLAFWILTSSFSNTWGFWGHKRINRIAVFTLPQEMFGFYKENIEYITANAVNPDKRRYAVKSEAPKHYIDIDHYGKYPYENVPRKWFDAVEKFTEDTLIAYGIAPWSLQVELYKLTKAFEEKDKDKILRLSADIGHYIGDIHVPLHTTKNYNGQLTNQKGIHGLWESRVPELFGDDYDYFVGKAVYLDKPLDKTWEIVLESNSKVEEVLELERTITKQIPEDKKYTYEERGATTMRTYSVEFSKAYQDALADLQEDKMRKSIINIGSFWMTAWVNAGQPDLSNLGKKETLTAKEQKEKEELEKSLNEGNIKGREHGN